LGTPLNGRPKSQLPGGIEFGWFGELLQSKVPFPLQLAHSMDRASSGLAPFGLSYSWARLADYFKSMFRVVRRPAPMAVRSLASQTPLTWRNCRLAAEFRFGERAKALGHQ